MNNEKIPPNTTNRAINLTGFWEGGQTNERRRSLSPRSPFFSVVKCGSSEARKKWRLRYRRAPFISFSGARPRLEPCHQPAMPRPRFDETLALPAPPTPAPGPWPIEESMDTTGAHVDGAMGPHDVSEGLARVAPLPCLPSTVQCRSRRSLPL